MKHVLEPTDNSGHSMECSICGQAWYIVDTKLWEHMTEEECPGSEEIDINLDEEK